MRYFALDPNGKAICTDQIGLAEAWIKVQNVVFDTELMIAYNVTDDNDGRGTPIKELYLSQINNLEQL